MTKSKNKKKYKKLSSKLKSNSLKIKKKTYKKTIVEIKIKKEIILRNKRKKLKCNRIRALKDKSLLIKKITTSLIKTKKIL
jgi:hypothetical protein